MMINNIYLYRGLITNTSYKQHIHIDTKLYREKVNKYIQIQYTMKKKTWNIYLCVCEWLVACVCVSYETVVFIILFIIVIIVLLIVGVEYWLKAMLLDGVCLEDNQNVDHWPNKHYATIILYLLSKTTKTTNAISLSSYRKATKYSKDQYSNKVALFDH